MKLFALVVLAVFSLVNGQTTIVRPDPLIDAMDAAVEKILNYPDYVPGQTSLAYWLPLMYKMNGIVLNDAYNYTLASFVAAVKQIGTSDSPLRALIAKEKQNSCFTNLLSSIDMNIEQTGYEISSCFELSDPSILNTSASYYQDLAASVSAVNKLPEVLLTPLVGRNPFTEPDQSSIIADYEQSDASFAQFEADFNRLMDEINAFTIGWQGEAKSIGDCLGAINGSLQAAYTMIQGRITVCRAYKGP